MTTRFKAGLALLYVLTACQPDGEVGPGGSVKPAPTELRVLLQETEGLLVVSCPAGALITDDFDKTIYTVPPGYDLVFKRNEHGVLSINGEWQRCTWVTIVPQGGEDDPPRLVVKGVPYRGSLVVRSTATGTLQAVNRIEVEEYLRGVLPEETYANWSLEALKSQAVVSRSYALARLSENPDAPYHLRADTSSQVYGGFFSEDPRTDEAVAATAGEVLAYGGRIVTTFFSSCCGGHTAAIDDVWPDVERRSFFAGVECGWCSASPNYTWEYSLDFSRLAHALAAAGYTVENPTGLRLRTNTRTGRVRFVVFTFASGEELELPGNELRRLLGYGELRSTFFEIARYDEDGLVFVGRGYGHGIGLCQWGSRGMAEAGFTYKEIINHYYTGAGIAQWDALWPVEPRPTS
ncbi:SpoIID/LytB domain-containing protein [bacterium]|nr:SpoIID/LytB domain-containing protein [bacterium]